LIYSYAASQPFAADTTPPLFPPSPPRHSRRLFSRRHFISCRYFRFSHLLMIDASFRYFIALFHIFAIIF